MMNTNNALSMDELEQVSGGVRKFTNSIELNLDTSKFKNHTEALAGILHHVIPCQNGDVDVQMTDSEGHLKTLLNSIFVCDQLSGKTGAFHVLKIQVDGTNNIVGVSEN